MLKIDNHDNKKMVILQKDEKKRLFIRQSVKKGSFATNTQT